MCNVQYSITNIYGVYETVLFSTFSPLYSKDTEQKQQLGLKDIA